ncbi:MAG: hypothetical protein U0936_25495 [Planctomycetaceae bacterium]
MTATGLSLTGADVGNYTVNTTATTTGNINPVEKTPSVSDAATDKDIQTTSGLVISRNVSDGVEVTHFRITNIQNGSLFLHDGTTSVSNGDFLTSAQANAGLRFTPANNLYSPGMTFGFDVLASLSNVDSGLGGSVVTAEVTVNAVNDAPAAITLQNTITTLVENTNQSRR